MEEAGATGPKVGYVGLGAMGAPMVERLLSSGSAVVVHNRDRAKAEPLLAKGAEWADSPKLVGRRAGGVVLVCVSDAKAVRAVTVGRSGIASGAPAGSLVVNMSTIAPEESRAVAERLSRKGIHYLESPVGGSRAAAGRGELLAFVGGEEADLATARPVLEKLTRRIELLGPVGLGNAMKLVNNLVTLGTVALDAEAIALGGAFGLARERVVDLLLAGGGESRMLAQKREAFVQRSYPRQFSLALADKDFGLIARSARDASARAPIAREARRLVTEALRAGLGEQDIAAVLEASLRRTGRPAETATAASPGAEPSPGPGTPAG